MTQRKIYKKDLPTLRRSIEAIDEQIVQHLIQRFKISEQIAQVKLDMKMATEDKNREKDVIEAAVSHALELTDKEVHFEAIRQLMPLIIQECKLIQEEVRNSHSK